MKLFSFKSGWYSLLIILSLTACSNNNEGKYAKETKVFNRYLNSLHISMSEDQPYAFICMTPMSCSECREKLFNFFETARNNNNIFLITSASDTFVNRSIAKFHFIYDSVGSIDRLNLPFDNVSVVFYKNNLIDTIESVNEATTPESMILAIKNRLN